MKNIQSPLAWMLAVVLVGCGSDESTDTTSTTDTGSVESDTSPGTDSSVTIEDTGTPSGDTATPTDSPPPSDTKMAGDVVAMDVVATDTAGLTLACAGTPGCDPATQVCCAKSTGNTCTTKGACTGGSLGCTSSDQCAGASQVCCLQGLDPTANSATCAASCGGGKNQLCTTKAECPTGQNCIALSNGIKYCG